MHIDFSGRKVLVTGAAGGIGRAAARALQDAGADVWALDVQPLSDWTGHAVSADVTDIPVLERVFAALPAFDVLIANAGIGVQAELNSTTAQSWNRHLDVNLSGIFHCVRLAAAAMKTRRSGSIVITASTNSFDGEPNLVAYNASKAGLLGLMRTAANELGPHGIRVNAVCPGLIRTRLTETHFSNPEVLKPYFAQLPMGRGGMPEEVASAMVFLASPLASYITGATLFVDGGQMCSKFATWTDIGGEFVGDHWCLP
jgi:NAD(P)-dependent dehydrogenase (short-subunit alcohol dehydrogenase family)